MASRADLRVFTIREANQSIHELRKLLPALRRTLKHIVRTEDRLRILDLICNRAVASSNPDLREYLTLKLEYHRKIAQFEEALADLEERGFMLRDLEKGIVHFVGRRGGEGGENVFLCWREGEKKVSHWHALEEELPDENGRLAIENEAEF